MATLDNLRSQGWHLSAEGLSALCENENLADVRRITRKALDVDIKEIGVPIVNTEIAKSSFGPVVLQIVKLRNISAPKSKPKSQTAPRMLKLILTDGFNNCQAIELKSISSLSVEKTIPGSKILIKEAPVQSGCILISPENCDVLEGYVSALAEKWEVAKLTLGHVRATLVGPPPWVNFGKKIVNTVNTTQGFKSLEAKKDLNTKENCDFQVQRQDAIAVVAQGAVKKVFGGGVKPSATFSNAPENNSSHYSREPRAPRQPRQKGKDKAELEKLEKPSQRVSLFDFLEDKLSLTTDTQSLTKPSTTLQTFSNNEQSYNQHKFENQNLGFQKGPKSYQKPNYRENNKRPPQTNSNTSNYSSSNRAENYPTTNYNNPRQGYDNYNNNPQDSYRHQNDRPPRFQKQRPEQHNFGNKNSPLVSNNSEMRPKTNTFSDKRFERNQQQQLVHNFSNSNNKTFATTPNNNAANIQPRHKPNTNMFVDKITSEMNNISLYNSKYETEKLHKPPNKAQSARFNQINQSKDEGKIWKWKIGDRCMAKYWEDDKFYNAVVTGITNKTCIVEFMEYGNFEEVLHCDCIPITTEKEERQQTERHSTDNQQFSGSLEFRRGKNRPFVRSTNKPYGQNRNYES